IRDFHVTGVQTCALPISLVKFYKKAIGRGIKPIVGADVWTVPSHDAGEAFRMTLLCMDERGFRNLSRLLTAGYAEAQSQGRALRSEEHTSELQSRENLVC